MDNLTFNDQEESVVSQIVGLFYQGEPTTLYPQVMSLLEKLGDHNLADEILQTSLIRVKFDAMERIRFISSLLFNDPKKLDRATGELLAELVVSNQIDPIRNELQPLGSFNENALTDSNLIEQAQIISQLNIHLDEFTISAIAEQRVKPYYAIFQAASAEQLESLTRAIVEFFKRLDGAISQNGAYSENIPESILSILEKIGGRFILVGVTSYNEALSKLRDLLWIARLMVPLKTAAPPVEAEPAIRAIAEQIYQATPD